MNSESDVEARSDRSGLVHRRQVLEKPRRSITAVAAENGFVAPTHAGRVVAYGAAASVVSACYYANTFFSRILTSFSNRSGESAAARLIDANTSGDTCGTLIKKREAARRTD